MGGRAAVGGVGGHAGGGMSRGRLKELGETLDAGQAGLIGRKGGRPVDSAARPSPGRKSGVAHTAPIVYFRSSSLLIRLEQELLGRTYALYRCCCLLARSQER
jgi:hypothetical protein